VSSEYHPPAGLPILSLNKVRERQAIEDEPTVKNLIDSKLLLDKEFIELILSLSKKSGQIMKFVSDDPKSLRYLSREFYEELSYTESDMKQLIRLVWIHERDKRKLSKKDEQKVKELEIINNEKFINIITQLSHQIQKAFSDFESMKGTDLDILDSTTLHVCKKCHRILSLNKFKKVTCECGVNVKTPDQIEQIPIYHFNDRLRTFLTDNMWLEHGIDLVFRRLDFSTLVGVHILGSSGLEHEIDLVAESGKEKIRVFCECKNQKLTVGDVFIFSGKMGEIGCTHGYIFTTAVDVPDDIIRLARLRHIDILSNVMKKGSKKIEKVVGLCIDATRINKI